MSGTRVAIISLGCSKNLVDTELMLGLLERAGYKLVCSGEEAEVVIVNTCGFITAAKEEAIAAILDAARLKADGGPRALLVAGCLAQRYGQELMGEMPEIDGVMGTGQVPQVVSIVESILGGERPCRVGEPVYEYAGDMPRIVTTGPHTAYIRIADGCNNRCSYCAIPYIRGQYRSRPLEALEREAQWLLDRGTREIILVAQDTTAYGIDIYGKRRLAELLARLAARGEYWLRTMYCYPTGFTGELLDVMAREKNICRYVDLPLQHASPQVLAKMNRPTDSMAVRRLVGALRERMPDITLRTTFIVGFPGESKGDFKKLMDFAAEIKFDRAGVFSYSPEEGTPAAEMSGQVPEHEKERRFDALMTMQGKISMARNSAMVGRDIEVLVEEAPDAAGGVYTGRSRGDAPEVDGNVFFRAEAGPLPGDIVRVRVTRGLQYDLRGELIYESAKPSDAGEDFSHTYISGGGLPKV